MCVAPWFDAVMTTTEFVQIIRRCGVKVSAAQLSNLKLTLNGKDGTEERLDQRDPYFLSEHQCHSYCVMLQRTRRNVSWSGSQGLPIWKGEKHDASDWLLLSRVPSEWKQHIVFSEIDSEERYSFVGICPHECETFLREFFGFLRHGMTETQMKQFEQTKLCFADKNGMFKELTKSGDTTFDIIRGENTAVLSLQCACPITQRWVTPLIVLLERDAFPGYFGMWSYVLGIALEEGCSVDDLGRLLIMWDMACHVKTAFATALGLIIEGKQAYFCNRILTTFRSLPQQDKDMYQVSGTPWMWRIFKTCDFHYQHSTEYVKKSKIPVTKRERFGLVAHNLREYTDRAVGVTVLTKWVSEFYVYHPWYFKYYLSPWMALSLFPFLHNDISVVEKMFLSLKTSNRIENHNRNLTTFCGKNNSPIELLPKCVEYMKTEVGKRNKEICGESRTSRLRPRIPLEVTKDGKLSLSSALTRGRSDKASKASLKDHTVRGTSFIDIDKVFGGSKAKKYVAQKSSIDISDSEVFTCVVSATLSQLHAVVKTSGESIATASVFLLFHTLHI